MVVNILLLIIIAISLFGLVQAIIKIDKKFNICPIIIFCIIALITILTLNTNHKEPKATCRYDF